MGYPVFHSRDAASVVLPLVEDNRLPILCMTDSTAAFALTMAQFVARERLGHGHRVEVKGIIASYGHRVLEDSLESAQKILALLKMEDIPLYRGANHSLGCDASPSICEKEKWEMARNREYGKDLLNDVGGWPSVRQQPRSGSGPEFAATTIRDAKSRISILVTGPLTDLAELFRIFLRWERENGVSYFDKIGVIVIRGGCYGDRGWSGCDVFDPVEGKAVASELNFYRDPLAVRQVMQVIEEKNLTMISGLPYWMPESGWWNGDGTWNPSPLASTFTWRECHTRICHQMARMMESGPYNPIVYTNPESANGPPWNSPTAYPVPDWFAGGVLLAPELYFLGEGWKWKGTDSATGEILGWVSDYPSNQYSLTHVVSWTLHPLVHELRAFNLEQENDQNRMEKQALILSALTICLFAAGCLGIIRTLLRKCSPIFDSNHVPIAFGNPEVSHRL